MPTADPDPAAAKPRTSARTWAERVVWFALGAGISWLAHWFKYGLPGRSPAACVAALFVVLLVVDARLGVPFRRWSYLVGALVLGGCVVVRPWLDPKFAAGRLWCRFDADAWRGVKESRSDARLWMIDDYLASHSPIGRPVAEIDALLGENDLHGREHLGAREWWLGSERGLLRIDSETLVIETDARDVVAKAWIYRD